MKSLLKITSIAILSLFLFSIAYAQTPTSIDGVEISANPEIASPGQNITVSVESYITDLNAASIVWVVDGKNYAQGTGLKFINITAPAIGKSVNILAAIMTVENREIKKSMTIKSGGVDLIWESRGYTPPFYKGKALFSYQNNIVLTAIPHLSQNGTSEIDPKTLLYKWKKNTKVIQDSSGFGKQSVSIQEEIPTTIDIEVEVTTKDGSQKGKASISLTPGNPSLLFYEEDPLYGVLYNKALVDNFRLKNQEIKIQAVPFTFNFSSPSSPLIFSWSINGYGQEELNKNQSVILRTKGDKEGSSSLSLEVKNENEILQGARANINIFFNKILKDGEVKFQ
ncbi:MAG TPA: hypothetical protein VJC02_01770 [Candidatus Paceibacterota bacterium]